MKVILLEELQGKGGEGDVVEVSRGFANNYLLPNRIAILATKGNLKQLEQRRKNIAKREEVRIANAEEQKAKLEAAELTIKAKVGDEGILFGSVTAQMIADALAEAAIEVDRRRVEIRQAIKTIGEHNIEVSLYRDIKAAIKVNVVDEAGNAVAPAAEEAAAEAEEAAEAAEAAEAVEEVAEEAAEAVEEAAEAVEEAAEAEEAAE